MRKKICMLSVACLFVLMIALSTAPAKGASTGQWITKYSVKNLTTGQPLVDIDYQARTNYTAPVLAGTPLNVTLAINLPMTVPDSTLSLSTDSQLEHSSLDRYWELQNGYTMTSNYNPNQATVSFVQNQGVLVISCYGVVPSGITEENTGGTVLHKQKDYAVITLKDKSNNVLDEIRINIVDGKISEFQTLLEQSQSQLQTLMASGVAPAYLSLYQNVLNGAQVMAQQGFVDNAKAQLQLLSVTEAPPITQGSSTADMLFIPVAAVLAVVAIASVFMFVRVKGKVGYVSRVIEDQIRDLEGLTLRASKIDRTLSSGLANIEDRLKRLVGE